MIELITCPHGGGLGHLIIDMLTWCMSLGGTLVGARFWWKRK